MASINVTYQDLNDAAARLSAGKEDLNQKLTELSALIDNLTSNGFQTERASGAYSEAYQKFTSGTRTAIGGLDELSRFLTNASQTLRDTDEGMAASINS